MKKKSKGKKKTWKLGLGNRVNYNRDNVIEITIRDSTGVKIEKFRFNQSDNNSQRRVAEILFGKYDLNLSPPTREEMLAQSSLFQD